MQKHEYIPIHKEHLQKHGTLQSKINGILQSIQYNEYSFNQYLWKEHNRRIPVSHIIRAIHKYNNNDYYCVENKVSIESLYSFLSSFPTSNIETWIFYENHVPCLHGSHHVYIRFDTWLNELEDVKQRLKEILDGFHLDYEKMRENGISFYKELCQYVFHPDRISNIAEKHGLTWDAYLDAIDL